MLKPPKEMFQNRITLIQTILDPDDPYHDEDNGKEVRTIIDGVRFDQRTVYSGSNNDRQVVSNATIVMMPPYTNPLPDLDESYQGSKIEFRGREYTITSINRDLEPFSNAIYQYKVGVV